MHFRIYFLFLSVFAFSQQPSYFVIGEEELAGIHLYSVIQDEDNSVWITTNEGLFYYNSLVFKHIEIDEIKNKSLFGLTKDNNGVIYCYNLSGQIFFIKNKKLQLYYELPKELISSLIFINFDDNNDLIISCKKVIRIKKNKKKSIVYENERDNCEFKTERLQTGELIFSLGIGSNYAIWKNGQLRTIEDKNFGAQNNYLTPYSTKSNVLFYTNNKQEILLKSKEKWDRLILSKFTDKSINYNIYTSKNSNLLWISSSKNGVYCYKSNGAKLYNNNLLFKDYFISGAFEDSEGNIWLLTFNKGIIVIPNLNVVDYSNAKEFHNDELLKITKANNKLFIGSIKGSIYKLFDGKISVVNNNLEKIDFLRFLPNKNAFLVNKSLVMDESFNQTKSIVQGNIYDVFENKNSLDIATRVGIENYNFKDDKISNKNYNTRTYAVFNDTIRRTFWVGSSTGLELINNNISSKVFYKNKEVFCTDIEKVNDQVWVASSDGVLVFEDDKFLKRIYYQKDTINDKPIKIKQVRGFVYIASKSGFVQYDLNKNKFKSFTKSRGLLSNSILDFEILKDTVYLITTKGLQKFNFKDIVFKDKANKVNVLKVLVNGTKEIVESDILQPTENNLEFEVLSISLTNKQNIKYHYLLEGYETKWNETSFSNNRIKYTNLPSGEFVLKVKLVNENGLESEITTFQFVIKTVFWKRWSFLTAAFIFIFLLFAYLYRLKINLILKNKNEEIKLEKYSQELNKSKLTALRSQMNPHFMFNALNSIQDFIIQNKKEEASNYLGDFADLMRSYLNHSQEDTITLKQEIETLELYFRLEKVRFEDSFDFHIEIDNSIENDFIEIPSFLIQPFVENAIKHGLLHKQGSKKITVLFYFDTQDYTKLICEIQDNGIGREASTKFNLNKRYKSFATDANLNRLELLNQNFKNKIRSEIIDLKDEQGNSAGTKVKLIIPIKPV